MFLMKLGIFMYLLFAYIFIHYFLSLFNGKLDLHRLPYQFSPLQVTVFVDAIYIKILQVKETKAGHHGRRWAASACCPLAGGPSGAGGGGGGAATLPPLPFLHAVQAVAGAHPRVRPREARRACPQDSEAGVCTLYEEEQTAWNCLLVKIYYLRHFFVNMNKVALKIIE